MALGWFRRRQKMVMIVMVLLMVVFLLSSVLTQPLDSRENPVIGRTSEGKVKTSDLVSAKSDLEILNTKLSFAEGTRPLLPNDGLPGSMQEINGEKADLAYALLLKEAEKLDIRVSETDVTNYLADNGYRGAQYEWLVSFLKTHHKQTEKQLKGMIARWLMVRKAFIASLVTTPPSEEELRRMYRDLEEKIRLRVVEIPAENFLKDVPEPEANDVQTQFERFRHVARGAYQPENPFGFGYLQPDRVSVQYLLVNGLVIERIARPSEKDIEEYYRGHRNELVKTVASQPAGGAATQYSTVEMTPEEARQVIIDQLAPDAIQARMQDSVTKAEALLALFAKGDDPNQVKLPADEVLKKPVKVFIENEPLPKAIEKLAEAANLEVICYPWGVPGEVRISPSLLVSVKPQAGKDLTLGDALASITEQLRVALAAAQATTQEAETQPQTQPTTQDTTTTKPQTQPASRDAATKPQTQPTTAKSDIPDLKWARCKGFENVLFPVEGIPFFPLVYKQTTPIDREQFARDEILRFSVALPPDGRQLWQVAFAAEPFSRQAQAGALKVGANGPQANVQGAKPGRLLWRLVSAVPSHAPADLKDTETLRKQVIDDLKTKAAFDLAVKAAENAVKVTPELTFLGAIHAPGTRARITETDFFARKVRIRSCIMIVGVEDKPDLLQELLARINRIGARVEKAEMVAASRAGGLFRLQLLVENETQMQLAGLVARFTPGVQVRAASPPGPPEYRWNVVPGLDMPTPQQSIQLVNGVFSTVPEKVEPPFPKESPPLPPMGVPSKRAVFILQRIDYMPPVIGKYEPTGRLEVAEELMGRQMGIMRAWFHLEYVKRRMNYVPEQGS